MIPNPKVVCLESRRPRSLLPVIIVQGMPGGKHADEIRKRLSLVSLKKAFFLEAPVLENPDIEECPQCLLTQRTLEGLAQLMSRYPSEMLGGVWLEAPIELDPRKLVEALTKVPGIRIEAITTWVDSSRFLDDFSSDRIWSDRPGGLPQGMSRAAQAEPVLETWIDQLEFSQLYFLMGMDSLEDKEQAAVASLLTVLHPSVPQIREEFFSKWMQDAFSWNLFDPVEIHHSCAWKKILNEKPNSPHYFSSKRPFHPERLSALIENWPENILRTFGTVWLARHNEMALTLSQTGPSGFFFSPEGYWVGTLNSLDRHFALKEHPELLADWDVQFGDRATELAFLSSEPLTEDWRKQLESCLLSDLEMRMEWDRFSSPFPKFDDDAEESEESDEGPLETSEVRGKGTHSHCRTSDRSYLRLV